MNEECTGVLKDEILAYQHSVSRWSCPNCAADLLGVLFEEPYFRATELLYPGDSGPGGNVPQEAVVEGIQQCPNCDHEWEVCG